MKAQTDSNSRGWKHFICREEKRKLAYWGTQGDPETGDPVSQDGEWGFIAFFCIACLSDADGHSLGRRDVSLTTYHLLEPPAVCSFTIMIFNFIKLWRTCVILSILLNLLILVLYPNVHPNLLNKLLPSCIPI
jgi:hypothetical protein